MIHIFKLGKGREKKTIFSSYGFEIFCINVFYELEEHTCKHPSKENTLFTVFIVPEWINKLDKLSGLNMIDEKIIKPTLGIKDGDDFNIIRTCINIDPVDFSENHSFKEVIGGYGFGYYYRDIKIHNSIKLYENYQNYLVDNKVINDNRIGEYIRTLFQHLKDQGFLFQKSCLYEVSANDTEEILNYFNKQINKKANRN